MATSADQAFANVACERVFEKSCAHAAHIGAEALLRLTQDVTEGLLRAKDDPTSVSMNPLLMCLRDASLEQWVITASGEELIPQVCHASCAILSQVPSRGAAVALFLPAARVGLDDCDQAVSIVALDHDDVECSVAPVLVSGSGESFLGQWQSQEGIFAHVAESLAAGLQQHEPDFSDHSHLNAYGGAIEDRSTATANGTASPGGEAVSVDELVQATREIINEQLAALPPDGDLDAAVYCVVEGNLGSYKFDVPEAQEERTKQFVKLAKIVRDSKPDNAAIVCTTLDKTTGVEHLLLFAGDQTGELRASRGEIERTSDKAPVVSEWTALPGEGVAGNAAGVVIAALDNRELTESFLANNADATSTQMQMVLTHLEDAAKLADESDVYNDPDELRPTIVGELKTTDGGATELAEFQREGIQVMLEAGETPPPSVMFVSGTLFCLQRIALSNDTQTMMAHLLRLHGALITHPIRSISLTVISHDKNGVENAYVFAADRNSDAEVWRALVKRNKGKPQIDKWERTAIAELPVSLVYPLVSALGAPRLEQELDLIARASSADTPDGDDVQSVTNAAVEQGDTLVEVADAARATLEGRPQRLGHISAEEATTDGIAPKLQAIMADIMLDGPQGSFLPPWVFYVNDVYEVWAEQMPPAFTSESDRDAKMTEMAPRLNGVKTIAFALHARPAKSEAVSLLVVDEHGEVGGWIGLINNSADKMIRDWHYASDMSCPAFEPFLETTGNRVMIASYRDKQAQ
jgi:hypothetical protein